MKVNALLFYTLITNKSILYSWPLNNTDLNCMQSLLNKKYYIIGGWLNQQMWNNRYRGLAMGLEHAWTLGSLGGSWNQSPNSKGKISIFLTNFHISIIPYCYFWTFAVGSISKSCITFSHHLESMFYIWLMITLILLNHMCIPISLHKMKLKVKISLNSHILKEILNIFFLISEFLTI